MYTENTLRRKLKNLGYRVVKDFIRYQDNSEGNPIAYNQDGKPEKGYSIIDERMNFYVAGVDSVFINTLDLNEVEAFLMNQE